MPLLLLVVTVLWLQTVSTKSSRDIGGPENDFGEFPLSPTPSLVVVAALVVVVQNADDISVVMSVDAVKSSDVNKGFVFPGVGSSHNDNDMKTLRGGVLCFYNKTHVVLYGASNARLSRNAVAAESGIIFTGKDMWTPQNQEFNSTAYVRVRVWHPDDLPAPDFSSEWIFMSTGSSSPSTSTFKVLDHMLGVEPGHVVVQVRGDDGNLTNYVVEGQGSSMSVPNHLAKNIMKWGGVLFAYNDASVHIWTPSAYTPNVYIMSGEDGWGDGSLTTSKSAYVRVTAWVSLSNLSFHKTPSMHSPSINCLQNHNLTFPFLFDLDEDIISVQARALDGENEGYIFNGGGAVMLDALNSFGGVVYAYSHKEIRIWHPVANNTYLIAVTEDWGHGNKSQYSKTAQVLFTIWKATSGLSGTQGSITSTRTSELTASTPITSTSCDVPTTINVSSSTVDSSATAMNACKSSSTTTQYTWGSCCFSTNTSEVLMNITQFLLNDLTVQKKNTSKYLRTLGSAQDNRTSARALGWFGGSICLSVVGVIILLDLTTICRKSSKTTDENTVGHEESKA